MGITIHRRKISFKRGGTPIKNSISIGKIKGIEIEINISWLVIFGLITFMLATNYFPQTYPNWSGGLMWVISLIISLLFFASLLAHELSHSIVSKSLGLDVKKISLFILGGIAQIEKEPDKASDEFKIAIAGPAMSVFLFLVFGALSIIFTNLGLSEVLIAPTLYLSQVNLILAIFNMIPAFPLDGGRVLRSVIWYFKKDVNVATKIASFLGIVFAYVLIFLGVLGVLSGNTINGIWLVFIGWFLNQQSKGSYQSMVMNNIFEGVKLSKIMSKEVISVPSDMLIEQVIEDYFYKHNFVSFPVIDENTVKGIVTLDTLKTITKEERKSKRAVDITIPLNDNLRVSEKDSVSEAMEKIFSNRVGRVLVIDEDLLIGIVSRSDILKYIKINSELNR